MQVCEKNFLTGANLGLEGLKDALRDSCNATKSDKMNKFEPCAESGSEYKVLASRIGFIRTLPKVFALAGDIAVCVFDILCQIKEWWSNSSGEGAQAATDILKASVINRAKWLCGVVAGQIITGFGCVVGFINPMWVHSYAVPLIFQGFTRLYLLNENNIDEEKCNEILAKYIAEDLFPKNIELDIDVSSKVKACDYLLGNQWFSSYIKCFGDDHQFKVELQKQEIANFLN